VPIPLNYAHSTQTTHWRPRWRAIIVCLAIGTLLLLRFVDARNERSAVRVRSAPAQPYSNQSPIRWTNGQLGVATFGPGIVSATDGRALRITSITVYVHTQPATRPIAPVPASNVGPTFISTQR
jgi:hypothetical protein